MPTKSVFFADNNKTLSPCHFKDKIQNLHNGLELALCSFKAACNKDSGIKWNYLPYANQQWKVKMKFAIAYVIGDTELHDKLCGKYGSFNNGVMRMCCHCNSYSLNINIPSVQPATKKWSPVDFHCFPGTDLNDINKNFKNNSHHNIRNVFHDLWFGTNQNNFHFATPGECLHMHQLGTAKRVLLSTTKKEGYDFSGMLISILIAMVSKHGTDIIGDHCFVKKQIEAIQLINIPKTIMHFINCINSTCHRKGMGTKLIKNHLYFHLTDYIPLWGSSADWDSAPNESPHKTEIKAPSKNTQGNTASLINQTTQLKSEKMMLSHATYHYNLNLPDPPSIERPDGGGSHFQIMRTNNGESTMKWLCSTNKTKPFFPSIILDFVCDSVLPLLENPLHICGVTELNCYDVACDSNFIFCSHPLYRSDSSLLNSVWMDWCLMKLDFDLNSNPKLILCQLLWKQPYSSIGGYLIDTNGRYAVAHRFQDEPKKTASEFIKCGCLMNSLYLFHANTIHSELAVIPEEGKDGCITNCDWLVISNCISWLDFFESKNATTPPSYKSLYNACTLKDDIQLELFEMALNDNKSSDYLSSSDRDSSESSN
eukprot:jgi/Psemu1/50051/gm1.50051_g